MSDFLNPGSSWCVFCRKKERMLHVYVHFILFSDKTAGERELCSGTEFVLDADYLKLISVNEEVLNLLWEKELSVP